MRNHWEKDCNSRDVNKDLQERTQTSNKDNKIQDITTDRFVNKEIDHVILTEEMNMEIISNNIAGDNNMIIEEGIMVGVVTIGIKHSRIRPKHHTTRTIKGTSIINNISNKVTKAHHMVINNIRDKIIKCNHINTDKEVINNSKDNNNNNNKDNKDKINTKIITIKGIIINNNQDTITTIIIKETIHIIVIITIITIDFLHNENRYNFISIEVLIYLLFFWILL